jgi:hypothetical protein
MKKGKTAIVDLPGHEFGSGNENFFFFLSVYLCSSVVASIFPAAYDGLKDTRISRLNWIGRQFFPPAIDAGCLKKSRVSRA